MKNNIRCYFNILQVGQLRIDVQEATYIVRFA